MGYLLGAFVASLLDPVGLTGYALSGALMKRLWLALLSAIIWALVVTFIVLGMRTLPATGDDLLLSLLPRCAAGLLVALITWAVARKVRERRNAKAANRGL